MGVKRSRNRYAMMSSIVRSTAILLARLCNSWLRVLLASYRRWQRRRRDGRRTLLTFGDDDDCDNDNVNDIGRVTRVVEIGRLIAEGGFSYVYEAFSVSDVDVDAAGDGHCDDDDAHDDDHDHAGGAKKRKYALKRINCADNRELVSACRREANAHRRLFLPSSRHPNLLELLGIKFVSDRDDRRGDGGADLDVESGEAPRGNESVVCYMLFPYLSHSLRGEITERNILMPSSLPSHNYGGYNNSHRRGIIGANGNGYSYGGRDERRRMTFSTREVLHLFGGILDGLIAIHDANMSHRDVKIENVMLRRHRRSHGYSDYDSETAATGRGGGGGIRLTPVLVDLGSSGPLTVSIDGGRDASSSSSSSSSSLALRRRALLSIAEEATSHTTMAYRPPELFEGGMIGGGKMMDEEEFLDYGKVDIWSLGCVLFGMMHGASPYEVEFSRTTNEEGGSRSGGDQERQYGHVRIVECSRLKILGEVPLPPWATSVSSSCSSPASNDENDDDPNRDDIGGLHRRQRGGGMDGKYPMLLYEFVRYMVHHDRTTRPSVHEVATRFNELHLRVLGERWLSYSNTDSIRNRGRHSNHDDFDGFV